MTVNTDKNNITLQSKNLENMYNAKTSLENNTIKILGLGQTDLGNSANLDQNAPYREI